LISDERLTKTQRGHFYVGSLCMSKEVKATKNQKYQFVGPREGGVGL